MAKRYLIEPEGWPCTLAHCRPGLFMRDGTLGLKTEYLSAGKLEVYVCESGEAFWGGTAEEKSRSALEVQPVQMVEGGDAD